MTDAGFFRGTSTEQDVRFSDKEKKLLKTMKFEECLNEKVDMQKVNLDSIKSWISSKIIEILANEDEVLVLFIISFLENERYPNAKKLQIQVTGFLQSKPARLFIAELWGLLLSAQSNPSKIPERFIEEKKEAIRLKKEQIELELNYKDKYSHHSSSPMNDEKRHKQLLRDLNELAGNTSTSKFRSSPQLSSHYDTKKYSPHHVPEVPSHETTNLPVQLQKSEVTSTQSDFIPPYHTTAPAKTVPETEETNVKVEPLSPSQHLDKKASSPEKIRSSNVPERSEDYPKGHTDPARSNDHHRRRSTSSASDKERSNKRFDRGRRYSPSPSRHFPRHHYRHPNSRSPFSRRHRERSPRPPPKDRSPQQKRRSPIVPSHRLTARYSPEHQPRRYSTIDSAEKQHPSRHVLPADTEDTHKTLPSSRKYSEEAERDDTKKKEEIIEKKEKHKTLPADPKTTATLHPIKPSSIRQNISEPQDSKKPKKVTPHKSSDKRRDEVVKRKKNSSRDESLESEVSARDDRESETTSKSSTPPKRKSQPSTRKKTQQEQEIKSNSPHIEKFPNPNPEKRLSSKIKSSSGLHSHKPRIHSQPRDEFRLSSRYHAKPTRKLRPPEMNPKRLPPTTKGNSEYSSESSDEDSASRRRKSANRRRDVPDTSSTKIKSTIITDERGRKTIKFKNEDTSIRKKPKYSSRNHSDRDRYHSEDAPTQDKLAHESIDKTNRKRIRPQNTYSSIPKKQLKKQVSTSSASSGTEESSESSGVSSESDTNSESSYCSSPSHDSQTPPSKSTKKYTKEFHPPSKQHSSHKSGSNRGAHIKQKMKDLGDLSSPDESTPQRYKLEKKLREKVLNSLSKANKPSSTGNIKQQHRK